jgi:hypothetical protein
MLFFFCRDMFINVGKQGELFFFILEYKFAVSVLADQMAYWF